MPRRIQYVVTVHKSRFGYDVHCPILPGCHSQGDSLAEALENIRDAIAAYLRMVRKELRGMRTACVEVRW